MAFVMAIIIIKAELRVAFVASIIIAKAELKTTTNTKTTESGC